MMQYFVRSTDGCDYRVGMWWAGRWFPGTKADALENLHGLGEPGAYVWGRTT